MEISYITLDPTKNITLLVETPVRRQAQSAVAQLLLRSDPQAEQVGFLEPAALPGARRRLQMMGGEFCGNASMALAALLAHEDGLSPGQETVIPLEVSGKEGLLTCRVRAEADCFRGTVDMPLPEKIEAVDVWTGAEMLSCPAVFLPGIVHAVVPVGAVDRARAEEAVQLLCAALRAEAAGLLLFDEAALSFEPLVYVAATHTAVWERGCGSGSAALGCYLAHRDKASRHVPLRQSGGVIEAEAVWAENRVAEVRITGQVRLGERRVMPLPHSAELG